MKKLTPIERRAINLIVRENIRILFTRTKKNPGKFIPRRVEIEPGEARQMIRLNRFMAGAMNWMGKKLPQRSDAWAQVRTRMIFLLNMSRLVQEKLIGQPGRRSPLYLTGKEAEMYFSNLEIVHRVFAAFRKNYVESAHDIKKADAEAAAALWAIRSILNVGHLPVEKTRFGR